MEIKYEKTGAERKALAQAVSEVIGEPMKYLGAPTFGYEITDWYTVTREGNLDVFDRADSEEVENLIERLAELGFEPLPAKDMPAEETGKDEPAGLTVKVPLENAAVGNLTNLLEAKGGLIKKALGVAELPVEVGSETVDFPWFAELPEPEEVKAYTHLISAICKMSAAQKRINAKEKPVENEKYAFRCFLLRLGFIGAEYKAERKILLRNFEGSSAYRGGAKNELPE